MTFSSLLCWLLFFLIVVPFSVLAQWSDDAAINTPICIQPNDQQLPVIATDGQDGAIIAWSDKRNGVTNPDIYAQRVSADGVSLWTANGIPICIDAAGQSDPKIIADGYGGAIIVWLDSRGGSNNIYAQRVNGSGAVLWFTNGLAATTGAGIRSDLEMESDGNGGAILVWQDSRSDAGDIFAQRIDPTGGLLWTPNGVAICSAPNTQSEPTLASDGTEGAIATWTDGRNGDSDIYVQRLSSTGSVLWTVNGIAAVTLPLAHYNPSIISDGHRGAIVAWNDWRTTDQQIYVQRFDSLGTPLWDINGKYLSDIVGNQLKITMVGDGLGGGVITYQDDFLGNGTDIYAERIDENGAAVWDSNGVLVASFDPNQTGLNMIVDGEGGVIISWTDLRNVPGWDVYAQRVDSSGAVLWDSAGIPVATASNFQAFNLMVSDGAGGAIVTWQDNRSGFEDDIYAQRISSDGSAPMETNIPVHAGWNLVSLPRVPTNFAAAALFLDAVAESFNSFSGGYTQVDTLVNGPGYWARFNSSANATVEGTILDSVAISVPTGNSWVLVGSLTTSMPANELSSTPPDAIMDGTLYGWNGLTYYNASTIEPGQAYWVFVNQPCILRLRHTSP